MPDDKPDFTAAQTKHAQDIKTRRTISRITGLTPNQVRNGLRSTEVISGPAGGNSNAPDGTVPVSLNVAPPPSPTMQFDPRPFANAPGTGQVAAPVMPDVIGTASTPYVMGTNRTTTDPTPADDSCALVNGVWTPTPAGGGPYDSVKFDFTSGYVRQVNNGSPFVGQADKTGGGVININMQPTLLFARNGIVFNSAGKLVAIGVEYQVGGQAQIFS